MLLFFSQNDEIYANVKKCFLFDIKIRKEKEGEMKRNKREIERDGKNGGDFLIPPNKH